MWKQKQFVSAMQCEEIAAPRILNHGFMENLFYFDMEYIPATRLVDTIIDADKQELLSISKRLEKTIDLLKQNPMNGDGDLLLTASRIKLENISNCLNGQCSRQVVRTVLYSLRQQLDKLPEFLLSCGGFCHGDLTLENILYDRRNGRFFLIDFLDNYIEHHWFDFVKLFQDIEGGWYQFRNPGMKRNNILSKMEFLGDRLWKFIQQNEKGYAAYHHVMLAITFARILPYAEPEAVDYLTTQIFNCLEKLKGP